MRFAINSLTGKVTQNTSSLDYDTQPNTYQMTVLASDSGGRRTSAPLVVKLSDLNDLAPEFDRAGFTARLREDALFFESPLAVHATDGDRPGTPNSNISYSIIGSNPPTFRSHFTMPNNYTGVILVVSRVDFESPRLSSTHTITLTIQAVDGGNPVRSSTSSVGISVLDVNDFPPLFSTNTATRHVFENSSTGTSVYTFNATDRDGGPPNNDVYYLISSGSNDQFAVDSSTGELTVIRSLDREKVASYSLVVLAIDRGVPPKSGTATLSVMIDDVNDVAPVFSQSSITVDVEENTHGVLYTMTATDADVDHQLQYVINWTHSSAQDPLQGDVLNIQNLFSIDRGTGAVSINGTLDRETVQSAVIALEVEDVKAATPGQTATGTLTINVKDKDDNRPLFSVDSVIATVDENAAEGVPINLGQVTVTDPDQDENSAFNLTLSKYNHCLEVLPSSARAEATVLIRVTNVSCFDYEEMTSMNFEVVDIGRENGRFVTSSASSAF
ncbi:protocadherin-11 X-linked-like [Littorina saxatilis]|uniref:protocadherin-11 X-linked-like n=1 Tax=Littorina saxatilis TaxID=31220 RepID=UPI0038B61B78